HSLLLTSCGTDAIIEVSTEGVETWTWLAAEHGYAVTPHGHRRSIDRRNDHRLVTVPTLEQATHCNSAVPGTVAGRPAVLASLFHQGEVVAIDRRTGRREVLASGLSNPHSIRPARDGWLVSDSQASSVVVLDERFRVRRTIDGDFNWVQDALQLD